MIELNGITRTYGGEEVAVHALRGIDLTVEDGEFVAIVRSVGAGKSSLLLSLLKESQVIEGSVHLRGQVAYAAQQPWIFPGTLRDNILFLRPFDEQKYQQVLRRCCLLPDLEILPAGDLTEIGDRGVTLSGGQVIGYQK